MQIALIDRIETYTEPYNRPYMLQLVANVCSRTFFMRNVGYTTISGFGWKDGQWESHQKWMSYICFEVDELTPAKREFLEAQQDYWGLCELKILPDDTEVTVIFPGI